MKKKKVTFMLAIAAFSLSIISIVKYGKDVDAENIQSSNLASVYVVESGGYVWGSGKVDPLCRYTYSTGYRLVASDVDSWKIDQWKGPTPKNVKITCQHGTQVAASAASSVSYDILEASCDLSFTGSYNASYEESITFPGDNRTHYLIQKAESKSYELYTTLVHSECTAVDYDWYPIVGYTNIKWGPWQNIGTYKYDPSGVVNTTLYTTYMTP